MQEPILRNDDAGEANARLDAMSRRDFVHLTTATGGALAAAGTLFASGNADAQNAQNTQNQQVSPLPQGVNTPGRGGLLYPRRNQYRDVMDTSGIWDFQMDPREEGEAQGWFNRLPASRPIPVPCSWNDLYDDARNYLGLSWYRHETFVPAAWRGQRVFLRVGSANYAARVWVNGAIVAQHLGGHLPFVADITSRLVYDRPNVIAVAVENKQLPERVPPGPGEGGGGVFGTSTPYPATTYDFFPYAGLHRPVLLYTVPAENHIDDVTVVTDIDGRDGVVNVKVATGNAYAGAGRARLGDIETPLTFREGAAEATMRVPAARLWSPQDPHLYPLTVTLGEGNRVTDSYSLDIGIRTFAVRGDQLLLNGQPIKLTGFGKHEDFPMTGRGQNLPMWVRDYDLLRWIGANSYRTSHYPYAEEAMMLADRLGFLVINEIPAVGLNFEDGEQLTQARLAQATQQIRELVQRDKNHPSTIMWVVANEPVAGPVLGAGPANTQAVESGNRFFRQMYAETKRLDPTRPVTFVGVQGGPNEWFNIFDTTCINRYYGWYTLPGQLDQGAQELAREVDALHAEFKKPVMIMEFGCDTLPGGHHQPPEMWTEEYQVEFLRRYLDVAAQRPFMATMHVWNFADFKTGQLSMRAVAMNFKGVFTRDRRPKASAHFLRERWANKQTRGSGRNGE